jgi:prophage maintenance system killer protein
VLTDLAAILAHDNATERAIMLMLYLMRRQMFNDGNKRTAMLAANQLLIANGAGIISVAEEDLEEFFGVLVDFYLCNDMTKDMEFVYDNCIIGM